MDFPKSATTGMPITGSCLPTTSGLARVVLRWPQLTISVRRVRLCVSPNGDMRERLTVASRDDV